MACGYGLRASHERVGHRTPALLQILSARLVFSSCQSRFRRFWWLARNIRGTSLQPAARATISGRSAPDQLVVAHPGELERDPVAYRAKASEAAVKMPVVTKSSVCSRRKPVDFYWRSCVDGRHIDAAVAALMASIRRPDRVASSIYLDADNEAMFRARLELAAQGRLLQGDHVKTISFDPDLDLFEIRWTDVQAIGQDPVSGLYGNRVKDINVRLYYIELGFAWVVGLLAHEKVYGASDDETNQLQDERIGCAVAICRGDAQRWWGVPELESLHGLVGPDLT